MKDFLNDVHDHVLEAEHYDTEAPGTLSCCRKKVDSCQMKDDDELQTELTISQAQAENTETRYSTSRFA